MVAGRSFAALLLLLAYSIRAQDPTAFTSLWRSTFDASAFDGASAVALDGGGNLFVAGQTATDDTRPDGLVMKINPAGQRVWARRFDSTISETDFFTDVTVDSAGNATAVGFAADRDAQNSLVVASYAAANGATRWLKLFPGKHIPSPTVAADANGNIYARTAVENGSGQIIRTYKFSPTGAPLWTNEISASRDLVFGLTNKISLLVAPDGGTFVATLTTSQSGDLDWLIVKLRADGSQQWRITAGGTNYEAPPLITLHPSGDLILAGSSQNDGGSFDLLIQRLSPNSGALVWETKLRGSSAFKTGSHVPADLKCDALGHIYLAGNSPTWGGFISRFDPQGFFEWTTHFPQTSVAVLPLAQGRSLLTVAGGLGWFDDNGTVLKSQPDRYSAVATADAGGNVYVASSYYKLDSVGDFGLAAEKLVMDRDAQSPTFTKLVQITGGLSQQTVQLAPEVSGNNLSFFWSHNGQPIPGATNRTFTIPNLDANTIGYYSLFVTNQFGATLSPDIEVLTTTPIFIRQPRTQTLVPGGDVAFSALAVGFEPQIDISSVVTTLLTYQWYYFSLDTGTIELTGETQSKLLIRNADTNWIGQYFVRATLFYPQLNLFFTADSDLVNLQWPSEYIEETWREQFLLTGEIWTLPTGMDFDANGNVALSLQSPAELDRASIANADVVSDAVEKFAPAYSPLPKGPHFADSQGNYYSIGETNTLDTSVDWVVAKHSANGSLLWQQPVSSLGREVDRVLDAAVAPDDNIVVTGSTASEETGRDALTVCLNKADGSIRWTAVFNDPNGVHARFAGETPSAIAIDRNGNTFVAGTGFWPTNGFYFLVSYDTNGAQRFAFQWPFQTFDDTAPLLALDPDGNAVLSGSFGLAKIDGTGRELWSHDLRSAADLPAPVVNGLRVDSSGNIYVAGDTAIGGALAKYDAFGKLIGQTDSTTFPDSVFRPAGRFFVDDFGNAYVCGTAGNIVFEKDVVAVKVNPLMQRLWMIRYDGVAQNQDLALDIKVRGNNVFLGGTMIGENTFEAGIAQFQQSPGPYQVKNISTSRTLKRGSTLHLEAQSTGNPFFYQWYHNTTAIPGATSASVDIPNVGPADEGFYALQVSDFLYLGISPGFAIRVADPPAITSDPVSAIVQVHDEIQLSAGVSGTPPLTYQWLVGDRIVTNATNLTLTIDNAQFTDRGNYRLVVSNAWGTAISSPAQVAVVAPQNLPPLVKITDPSDRLVQRDTTPVHLRAAAYDPDGRVVKVVFQVNGITIGTITSAPFEISFTPPAVGLYKVSATATDNLTASTTSDEVEVVIAPAPKFTSDPPAQLTIAENTDLVLTAQPTTVATVRYQWRLNGANIPGATNRTYTVGGAQVRHSGRYAVLAINEGAATISSRTEVIIDAPTLNLADQFADATEVTDVQFTGRGNNRGAAKEAGEPNHARRRGGASVWLKWRAPATGVMTLNTRGSAIDTLLAIYTGDSVSSLTQLAADDERGGFHCSSTRFNAVKGQLYNIAIDGFNGQTGNIVLSWALDSSSRPLPVITSEPDSLGSAQGSVAAYHVDADGTGLTFQWFFNGYPVPGATNSGLVLFDITRRNLGDYVVRVTNDGGSVETQEAELELGNADEPVTQDRVEDLLPQAAPSRGNLAASFAGYPTISPGIPYRKFFNTAGATADSNEPVLGDGGGASKWFLVNAGGNGTLVADTIGSDFPNVITLHDPTQIDTLPVLANGVALRGGASRVEYPATSGMAFLIRVDGIDQAEGNVVLNITIGSQPNVTSTALDQVIAAGANATLSATVDAAPAAAYQWYLNDIVLPGQTTATLQVSNFDAAQAGQYSLQAFNALGSVKKTIAYLELARDVTFTAPSAQADGSIHLHLEGNTRSYYIDFTSDFLSWTNLFSGHADNGALDYVATPAANEPHGFYRARWQ